MDDPVKEEIPEEMVAAQLVNHGARLEMKIVPVVRPKEGQVLVRVEVCGVCHTDLHVQAGDWSDARCSLPRTLGHEVVGRIVEIGELPANCDQQSLSIGDRVCIPWMHWACGVCEFCLQGWETVCLQQLRTGFSVDGGFAQYCLANAAFVVPVPPKLSPEQAAPISCAGVTVYKALKMTGLRPNQYIAIVGALGGLGHLAIQYAKAMKLTVIAIDCKIHVTDLKDAWGADYYINLNESDDLIASVKKLSGDLGVHASLILVPSNSAVGEAVKYTRPLGKIVIVAMPPGNFEASMYDVVVKAITIKGSIVGTRQDLHEALQLAADGNIYCSVKAHLFEDINSIMMNLKEGKYSGRAVLKM